LGLFIQSVFENVLLYFLIEVFHIFFKELCGIVVERGGGIGISQKLGQKDLN
jgi:hypothetical protein